MSGRIVDLADPNVILPTRLGVDTNVLVNRLVLPKIVSPEYVDRHRKVRGLFAAMRSQRTTGVITSTTLQELMHASIRASYTADLGTYARTIGNRKAWELLFKARPDLLTGYRARLTRIVARLATLGVVILQPDELGPIPNGRRLEDELVEWIGRYRLLSNDAAILLELKRAGIDAIVTEDPDLRRAATDFDVDAWL